jgi:hypothetical protein
MNPEKNGYLEENEEYLSVLKKKSIERDRIKMKNFLQMKFEKYKDKYLIVQHLCILKLKSSVDDQKMNI